MSERIELASAWAAVCGYALGRNGLLAARKLVRGSYSITYVGFLIYVSRYYFIGQF